jgi:protein gp37
MGKDSSIQWTDATWNIARGCTKVDADCLFCYMMRDSMDGHRYDPKTVVRTKTVFNFPLKYKEIKSKSWDGPPLIFTSSLTDVFHEAIDPYRDEMWEIIRKCPHLIFQILTKRPERILDCIPKFWLEIRDRVWLGTSIGSPKGNQRALDLIKCRDISKTLFLSLEPIHEELNFRWVYWPKQPTVSEHELLKQFDWVILGGESGNDNGKYRYRPCKIEWIELMITHCKEAGVPVFVKQLGTYIANEMMLHDRHGGDINEWPERLRIREMPKI